MDPQTAVVLEAGAIDTVMMIIIATIAGWLAGLIMKGKGMGFIVNTLLGIVQLHH